ncbi:hypothetical protein QFZ79_002902 [Arthrobacter sp. V4I6]|nr:hypothetical protein [Arthrobacter sp. V4I6]
MNEWLMVGLYVFGLLHVIPAWYFGKAAGIAYATKGRPKV